MILINYVHICCCAPEFEVRSHQFELELTLNDILQAPCLLAASPTLQDPHFQKAVLLLLEHDRLGALGFIINKKSHMNLQEVVAFDQVEIPPHIPVWNAGPVDSSAGFVLHNQNCDFFERQIAPGVSLSSSEESLRKLIETLGMQQPIDVLYPYRLLVGYAGWTAGQLEAEIRAGSWVTVPLDLELLFNSSYEEVWYRALQSVGLGPKEHLYVGTKANHWLH